MKTKNCNTYSLSIPVFKQGDDLSHCIEHTKTLQDAFMAQAKRYEVAAEMCKRMASIAVEHNLDVFACTHEISINCENKEIIESLLQEGMFRVWECDGCEECYEGEGE